MTEFELMVDTAGSWDVEFPPPSDEDFIVEIASPLGDYPLVLVSSRYVGAVDAADAVSLAVDAFHERLESSFEDTQMHMLTSGMANKHGGRILYHVRVCPGPEADMYSDEAQPMVAYQTDTMDWIVEPEPWE